MERRAPQIPPTIEGAAHVDLGDRIAQIVASLGRIDTENLKLEVEDIGASAIWWGLLNAEAQRQAGLAAMEEDIVKATIDRRLREEALARGEKPTVDQVKAMILAHPTVQAARLATLNAEANASMVESTKYALVQKARTLEALAGMIVDELRARAAPGPTPHRVPLR